MRAFFQRVFVLRMFVGLGVGALVLILGQHGVYRLYASSPPVVNFSTPTYLSQTNWDGGVGISTSSQYSSASDMTVSATGQISGTSTAGGGNWYNAGWANRREITIAPASVSGTQTNFPVFLDETVFDAAFFSALRTDGLDLIFTDSDGTTLLDRELVSVSTTAQTLEVWVRIPTLSDTATTTFFAYYNNPSGSVANAATTWDSSIFNFVAHLDEDSSVIGTPLDSSTNGATGSFGNNPTVTSGPFGIGTHFNGTDQYISFPDAAPLDAGDNHSFSLWVNPETTGIELGPISKPALSPYYNVNYALYTSAGSGDVSASWYTGTDYPSGAVTGQLALGSWQKIDVQFDRGNDTAIVGIDNTFYTSDISGQGGTPLANAQPLYIGGSNTSTGLFGGVIDEVRIYGVSVSTSWFATEYNNQSNPATFYSVGATETPSMTFTTGTLVSAVFDGGVAHQQWGTVRWTSTDDTSVIVKARSSNDSGMSGATAFASCGALSQDQDLSSETCVTDGERYIQYQIELTTTTVAFQYIYIVSLGANTATVTEDTAGSVAITVHLDEVSGADVTVPYTVSGSAANPADHDLSAGNIVITAGNLTGSTSVNIVADAVQESTETIILTMGAVTNGASGDQTTYTISILDDELPTPTFVTSAQSYANGVFLDWDIATSTSYTITEHVVEYKLAASSSYTVFSTTSPSVTHETVIGLADGQTYDFRVYTVTNVGTSTTSSVQTVTRNHTALSNSCSFTPVTTTATGVLPQNVVIDPSTQYQTWASWEATDFLAQNETQAMYDNHAANWTPQVLQGNAEVGINRVRLEFFPDSEKPEDEFAKVILGFTSSTATNTLTFDQWGEDRYTSINDDADPFTTNANGFHHTLLNFKVDNLVEPYKTSLLSIRGEQFYVNLTFVDFVRTSSSTVEYYNTPDEYAELVLSAFQHIHSTYGWIPDAVQVMLEPDATFGLPPTYSSEQVYTGTRLGEMILATGDLLAANGYRPEFIGPSVTNVNNVNSYLSDMLAVDPAVASYLSEVTYHNYWKVTTGNATNQSLISTLASSADAIGARTGQLEWWVSPDTPNAIENFRNGYYYNYMDLHDDLVYGNNSSWQINVFAGVGATTGTAIYVINTTTPPVTVGPTVNTQMIKQYVNNIRTGDVRVSTTQSGTFARFNHVAFVGNDCKYKVISDVVNGSGVGDDYSIQGLPGGDYEIAYVDEANPFTTVTSSQTVVEGDTLQVTLPTLFAGTVAVVQLTSTTVTTTPTTPYNVAAIASSTEVMLTWNAPTSTGGATITDYIVEYRPAGGSFTTFADGVSTATNTTVTGLTNGTEYGFRVAAVNSVGMGASSTVVSSTPSLALYQVVITTTTLGVVEGGATATYTIQLAAQPTTTVTISLSTSTSDISISTTSVDFTSTNWNVARTVTITATDDALVEGTESGAVSHSVSSGDAHNGITVPSVTTTITDNDTAGVTINTSTVTVTEGGATATYTIALAAAPTGTVTIGISADADATTSIASATFNSSTWNTAQTVTVTASDDALVEGTHSTVISHSISQSPGGAFDSVSVSSVTMSVTDNETLGITVVTTSLAVTEDGATDSFTMVLDAAPTSSVVVTLSTSTDDITVSSTTLTFTTGNWNTPQTVTVTARDDNYDEATTHTSVLSFAVANSGGAYDGFSVPAITFAVTDNDTAGVSLSTSTATATEGGANDTYTVVLDSQPTSSVVVTLVTSTTDISVSPTVLTFTSSSWNVAQTVTITATDDSLVEGTKTGVISHTVSATSNYNGIAVTSVTTTITDNDTAGVTISTSTVAVNEGGATATYTIALATAPTGTVTISISADAEATTSIASATFTSSTWNTAQTVTVTASDDALVEGTHSTLISHSVSQSPGGSFDSVSVSPVTMSVTDNDTAGVSISTSTVAVAEGGATATYTIALAAAPTGTVTIGISADADATTSIFTASFNSSTWNTAQTVTVTAVDDAILEGTHSTVISHNISQSPGGAFDGVSVPSVTMSVTDNETLGVTVVTTSLAVAEGGATDSFTMVLDAAPTSSVVVTLSTSTDDITLSTTSLTFTTGNWNSAQTVTVTARDDNYDEATTHTSALNFAVANSGGSYDGFSVPSITFDITDNDTAGVSVSTGALALTEGAGNGSYTIVLDSQPTTSVSIALTTSTNEIGVSPSTLTFTSANWNTPQTITVSPNDDAIADGTTTTTITHAATSAGTNYNGISIGTVTTTVADDESPNVTVSQIGTVALTEGGSSNYTLVLTTQPSSTVTITLATSSLQASISTTSIAFTTTNWNSARTVTITATDDNIADGARTTTITHTATSADAAYNGIGVSTVTTTVADNDTAGVSVSQSGILFAEGDATSTYTVVLTSEPTANVTVWLTTSTNAFAVSTSSLLFTATNWNVAKTVSVIPPADDAIAELTTSSQVVYTALSADGNYNGININTTTVTLTDNDTASVVIAGTPVSYSEGSSDSYTVALSSEPTAPVTVMITTSSNNANISTTSIIFTSSTYNTPVTLTVSTPDDSSVNGDRSITITHTASSTDSNYHALSTNLTTTIIDNDVSSSGGGGGYQSYATSNSTADIVPEEDTGEEALEQLVDTSDSTGSDSTCALNIGQPYKGAQTSAVYIVTQTCELRPFRNPSVFFTYFDSFAEVITRPQPFIDAFRKDTLGFVPQGPKYDPQYGALVKVVDDPRVYLLLGGERYWITSEDVFNALNYQWDWIEDVDADLLDQYEEGLEINFTDRHPNYTLIKYEDDPKVYRLEPSADDPSVQVKRHIVDEVAFLALGYRWDRIVIIAETETYPDGPVLTASE